MSMTICEFLFSGFIGPKNGMNDAHLQTVEDFYQSQNLSSWCRFKDKQKTSRGKEKYLQFFFLKTLSLITISFNFLSTQKILAIYACLKKEKAFLHLY